MNILTQQLSTASEVDNSKGISIKMLVKIFKYFNDSCYFHFDIIIPTLISSLWQIKYLLCRQTVTMVNHTGALYSTDVSSINTELIGDHFKSKCIVEIFKICCIKYWLFDKIRLLTVQQTTQFGNTVKKKWQWRSLAHVNIHLYSPIKCSVVRPANRILN